MNLLIDYLENYVFSYLVEHNAKHAKADFQDLAWRRVRRTADQDGPGQVTHWDDHARQQVAPSPEAIVERLVPEGLYS